MPCEKLAYEIGVADVTLNDREGPVGLRPREVLATAPEEVVQDYDLGRATSHQLIRDRGSHRAGAPGYEHARTTDHESTWHPGVAT